MAAILVCYGTSEGQTEKIAERIGDRLSERGYRAPVRNVAENVLDPTDYDAVLVGSSIHRGSQQTALERFVRDHRETLAAGPTGLFDVSLSAVSDDPAERQQRRLRRGIRGFDGFSPSSASDCSVVRCDTRRTAS